MKRMAVRRMLLRSTAEPNEHPGVELPWPGISCGGAVSHRSGERNRSFLGLLIRDQGKTEKNKRPSEEAPANPGNYGALRRPKWRAGVNVEGRGGGVSPELLKLPY